MLDSFNDVASGIEAEVNKYADELIAQANGDYDFAAKWIENAYKTALGTDDQERAAFLKKVANGLEAKVGRINFDHQTGTYRVNEDAQIGEERTIRTRETALARLAEDEQVLNKQYEQENQTARQDQAESLNERGILSSTRGDATGLAGRNVGELEGQIGDRMSALQRAFARDRQDVTTSAADQLQDIGIAKTRGLEDLTTTARRGAQDAQDTRDYSLEAAARERDRRKLAAEQQRRSSLNQSKSYSDLITRGALGLS